MLVIQSVNLPKSSPLFRTSLSPKVTQVTSLVPHLYQRCPMSNSLLCPTTHLKKDAESVTLLGAAVYPPSPSKRKTAARIPPSSGETPPLSFDTVT